MSRFSQQRINQIARKFGQGVPGLEDELQEKLNERSVEEVTESPLKTDEISDLLKRSENYGYVIAKVEAAHHSTLSLREVAETIEKDNVEFKDIEQESNERIVIAANGGRPVVRILHNQVTTEFLGKGQESKSWSEVIVASKKLIDRVIPAVGRIELTNSGISYAGTGWLIAKDIIVTNAHVTEEFAMLESNSSRFVFKPGLLNKRITSNIDFLEEGNPEDNLEYPITSIVWVARAGEPDVAFLRVEPVEGKPALPQHIELAKEIKKGATIAAIGYPAREFKPRDQNLVESIFGSGVYGKKRLSLGLLGEVTDERLQHDCSTLGGNSGSVLLDLETGEAVGLHKGGYLDDSANLGVTAPYLQKLLALIQQRDILTFEETTTLPMSTIDLPISKVMPSETYQLKFNIPVEISIKLGNIVPIDMASATQIPSNVKTGDKFEIALNYAKESLRSNSDIINIRKGYRFKDGWITEEPVILIETNEKLPYKELFILGKSPFPREILGVATDVRTGHLSDPLDELILNSVALERPGRPAGYKSPDGATDPDSEMFLGRIRERMSAIFHVSPDAGFPNLKKFFQRINKSLTATMFEWEKNHISDAIEEAMKPAGNTLKMVTQKRGVGEADATEIAVEDMKNRIGKKFSHVWASTRGTQRLIPNSYHIKVASRDQEEVWLSSGNWKNSNQPKDPTEPDLLTQFNREWHAIISNKKLATLFQKYIEYDFDEALLHPLEQKEGIETEEAEFFVPLKEMIEKTTKSFTINYSDQLIIDNEELDIQPLLTPDLDKSGKPIFMKEITEMIQRATKSIYIQNQSFNLTDSNNEEFDRFFQILKEKQRAIGDVRIIFRDAQDYHRKADQIKQQELLERLKDFGLDVSSKRLKIQPFCHTKGIIIDSKEVLLGSQNLTNQGSLFNRDASLLIRSTKVAQFYEKIFLFDWENLAHNKTDMAIGAIRRAKPGEETPKGYRRVNLSELIPES